MLKAASLYLKTAMSLPRWAQTPLDSDPHAAVGLMPAAREQNFLDLMHTAGEPAEAAGGR